jgi:hypothetical protein
MEHVITFLSLLFTVASLVCSYQLVKKKQPNRKLLVPLAIGLLLIGLALTFWTIAQNNIQKYSFDIALGALMVGASALAIASQRQAFLAIALIGGYLMYGLHRNSEGISWAPIAASLFFAGAFGFSLLVALRKRWQLSIWIGVIGMAAICYLSQPTNLISSMNTILGHSALAAFFAWLSIDLGRLITRDLTLAPIMQKFQQIALATAGFFWLFSVPLWTVKSPPILLASVALGLLICVLCFAEHSKRLRIVSVASLFYSALALTFHIMR